MTFSAPSLTFLATISVQVGEPIEIGRTSAGVRRIIPILGGKVEGPGLRGTVLPAGADFQLLRTATLTELEAKYAIETDDGERLYVNNFGLRSGSEADIAALLRGEPVDPERIYFRCTPRIEAPEGGAWAWLSSRILIGTGIRLPDEVRLEISVVE
ncbi:DUF3237 domain-containing protein [Arthrobacter sp. Helios]|uniref:DUF3237 domain-containing protein n=1 Tax=Arthrobacter sp. Helios TaxID=2828862 RepID=UPI0020466B1A|nr:DUF3237 domain-containing protein [Arthrobacter sp. Helios]UPO76144.1 DUF3237 domain-containing protein [Arthrobacter sp. Helios]